MSLFTVLGSTGFIGRHLAAYLEAAGHEVFRPARDAADLRGRALGHVVYCIGTTGNFRQYPQAAVDAHVNVLHRLMGGASFDSWLYLSSTRVYGGLPGGDVGREDMSLPVMPSGGSIFELTKLLGEAVCLDFPSDKVRVARLSNIYGQDQSPRTFLGQVLSDLKEGKEAVFLDAPGSSRDYLNVDDAVAYLAAIAQRGRERIYNVASGANVSHAEIAAALKEQGHSVRFGPGGPVRVFPRISAARLVSEFGPANGNLAGDLVCLARTCMDTSGAKAVKL